MKLTLRQLSYFVAAAETGGILAASRRENISQPAISTAVSHLERELGVQLFLRRHARGLSLTAAGRSLLREAKQLLKQADGLYSAAAEVGHQVRGELAVGWFATLAPILMPQLVSSFMTAHPGTRIASLEGHQQDLVAALRRAEIDLALTYDLQISEDIAFRSLAPLAPHALLGESHPCAGRSSVTLHELAALPMVMLDLPMSRDYFQGLFERERLRPLVAWSSPQFEVVRTLVANGFGYTLANVRPLAEVALDGRRLLRVPIAGDPPPLRVGIATFKPLQKTRLALAFEQHLADSIGVDHLPGMAMARGAGLKGARRALRRPASGRTRGSRRPA